MKDYAKKSYQRSPKKSSKGRWAILIVLIVLIGLFGLTFYFFKTYNAFSKVNLPHKTKIVTQEKAKPKQPVKKSSLDHVSSSVSNFDFYQLLSEMKVPVSGEKKDIISDKPKHYTLQIASFKALSDAKLLQERLAGKNIHVVIQERELANGATWFQIFSDTYDSIRPAEELQRRLHREGIETLLISRK